MVVHLKDKKGEAIVKAFQKKEKQLLKHFRRSSKIQVLNQKAKYW